MPELFTDVRYVLLGLRQTSFEDTNLDNMDLLTSTALVKFVPCGRNDNPPVHATTIVSAGLLVHKPSNKLLHVLKLARAQQILQDVLQEAAT